jgi:hypothetical protein
MNAQKLHPGDRVRDRFYILRPGDSEKTGTVLAVEDGHTELPEPRPATATVRWDNGKIQTVAASVLEFA